MNEVLLKTIEKKSGEQCQKKITRPWIGARWPRPLEEKRRPAANRAAAVLAPQARACGHRGQRAVTDPPFPAKGFLPCCARR